MRYAVIAARVLLGLAFVVFGANGLFHFMKAGPMPAGDAGVFAGIMAAHHYMAVVAFLQMVGGLLLLVGRFVPLGLTILGPILVNILLFHFLLEPTGFAPGVVCTLLELFLIYAYRLSFRGLFDAAPELA